MTTLQGAQTFFGGKAKLISELKSGEVAIAGAPHDSTHTTRFGTRYGPRGVRSASASIATELRTADRVVDLATGMRRRYIGDHIVADVGDLEVFPTDVMRTTEGIRHGIADVVRRGAFPVLLGGDHYTSYPSFLGFADALQELSPTGRVGFIQFDGHLDFNDDSAIWGKHNHGTNARRISEHDIISVRNMVWIGIQGWVTYEEWSLIQRMGGTIFTMEDVRHLGVANVVRRAAEIALRGCDWIYVSLDIDVLDAGFSPGTGGVVVGGMRPIELVTAMHELSRFPVGALDVTEVSPNLDTGGRSVRYASEAISHLLGDRLFEDI